MKKKNEIEKERSDLISFMKKHIPDGIDPYPVEATNSNKDYSSCSIDIVNNTINPRRRNANKR